MISKSIAAMFYLLTISGLACAWTTPVPVSELNTQYNDTLPFPSTDGLTMYFTRGQTSTFYYNRMYQATRSQPTGAFTSVQEISTLNNNGAHIGRPWVSPNNLSMYYMITTGDWDIKVSTRNSTSDAWQPGAGIAEINALGSVSAPSLSADELTIAFTINYGSGGLGGEDIVLGTRPDKNTPFGNFTYQTAINSSEDDGDIYLTPDALSMYFISQRNGSGQIFKATRNSLSDTFGNPEHFSVFDAPGVNLSAPALSSDGSDFYFAESINGGTWDIYVSHIPEPATCLLLGLGALVLRKK